MTKSYIFHSLLAAARHANELIQIVKKVKDFAQQHNIMSNQVNIVAHSKGGLDARVYLDQSGTHDVANLIMIGTPNGGDVLADDMSSFAIFAFSDWENFFCTPALYDLTTYADDISAQENTHTNYYTIYGDWNPSLPKINCPAVYSHGIDWLNLQKEFFLTFNEPNDGIVPASSVEKLPNYVRHTSLEPTHDCHTNLLSKPEFDIAKDVLEPLEGSNITSMIIP
jgi:Palmitoyl protein thioesterase